MFYLITALSWAILACMNQLKYFPETSNWKMIGIFALNFIFCPFAIIVAIITFNQFKVPTTELPKVKDEIKKTN